MDDSISEKAKPVKTGDAKLWVYCHFDNDCQATEEVRELISSYLNQFGLMVN